MNLSKLKVDMEVANYKAMCKLLGEKEKGGNQKKAQIKTWECYFAYKKDGNKFIIEEIYEEIKNKIDLRFLGNASIYKTYVEKLIIDMLVNRFKDNKQQMYLPTCSLLEHLYIVNRNYSYCKENPEHWSKMLGINEDFIDDFYMNTYRNFQNTINNALNSLENQAIALYEIVIMIVLNNEHEHRKASDDEITAISKCEDMALQKIGFSNKQSVIICKQWNVYKQTLKDIMFENPETNHIKYYYKAYSIYFHDGIIDKQVKYENILKGNEDIKQLQQELNQIVCEKTIDNTQKRQNNSNDKGDEFIEIFGEQMFNKESDILRSRTAYIENNEKLVNALIKR